jgi:magnesium-transporting ATPase (P-type)
MGDNIRLHGNLCTCRLLAEAMGCDPKVIRFEYFKTVLIKHWRLECNHDCQHGVAQGKNGGTLARLAVNLFVMVEMIYLFNCRSLTRSFWSQGPFSNPWIRAGIGITLALQMLLTYVPVMNAVFGTAPIELQEWGEIVTVGLACSLIVGIEKKLSKTVLLRTRLIELSFDRLIPFRRSARHVRSLSSTGKTCTNSIPS